MAKYICLRTSLVFVSADLVREIIGGKRVAQRPISLLMFRWFGERRRLSRGPRADLIHDLTIWCIAAMRLLGLPRAGDISNGFWEPLPAAMDPIEPELLSNGFAFRPGAAIQKWLGAKRADWEPFAASWNALGEDRHMADGGRYRRRRYAVFDVTRNGIVRAPHQPHFQAKTYNRLNGGLDRWFDPVLPDIGDHPIIRTLIERLTSIFTSLPTAETSSAGWHVELHQFRIEARADAVGLPTPEGTHRDGVDGAFVMLINRENVSSGITHVSDAAGRSLGQFTLSQAGDAVFLDDMRVFHGVTPIEPLDPGRLATRDVLVITFTRA